jgi:thymidylate synthase
MNKPYCLIEDTNLSTAWAKAFLRGMENSKGEIQHCIVSVTDFRNNEVIEKKQILNLLDKELDKLNKPCCETIAGTIFPHSLWNPNNNRSTLFNRYEKTWPRIKKYPNNQNGTYFKRLISFESNDDNHPINQLEKIIQIWDGGTRRRSAFQAAIFDPRKDHKSAPYLGFPCLQHVFFSPTIKNNEKGLIVTGMYATQYLLEKAYGNYLGLCRLGHFMAKEMDLKLVQMTCIASVATLGNSTKSSLNPFKNKLENLLND